MNVKEILNQKGREVITLDPGQTLADAIGILAEHGIGALVVTKGGGRIAGILSERDIVRAVAGQGADALQMSIASVMTTKVKVCHETSTVHEVMEIMTRGRFRHLPVEKNGVLDGIVSIGDVVKRRIEEVEREADEIRSYIATA